MAEPIPPSGPMSSVTRDASRVIKNTGATAEEIRGFLNEMKGKSPKEMLGAVASSSLVGSLITAVILIAILIAAFTVAPYALSKMKSDRSPNTANLSAVTPPSATSEAASTEPGPSSASAPASQEGTNPGALGSNPEASKEESKGASDIPNPDDILDRLGVGETKSAPLNVNPLDRDDDDLLKDLE